MMKQTMWERERVLREVFKPAPATIRTKIVGGWIRFQGWFKRNVW